MDYLKILKEVMIIDRETNMFEAYLIGHVLVSKTFVRICFCSIVINHCHNCLEGNKRSRIYQTMDMNEIMFCIYLCFGCVGAPQQMFVVFVRYFTRA